MDAKMELRDTKRVEIKEIKNIHYVRKYIKY